MVVGTFLVPARDLSWEAVRSSGPGGQNVNKVSTKVILRFDLEGTSALREDVKVRLRISSAHRIDAEGFLVLSNQKTRSLAMNLALAREQLVELIQSALVRPRQRYATRPTRAAKARRLNEKRRQGDKKRGRGSSGQEDV
ncbi:MAG: aminoacyl-tRNA hydrolase [Deltaproteobacteria bacterium]|nr:aminoacyl-tRNA hydrolase [Deltaproteobacteria bacterium]